MQGNAAMKAHVEVSTSLNRTFRVQQLEAMFDVPPQEKLSLQWDVDLPLEDKHWNVGLICGPSGCGKSTIAKTIFTDHYHPSLRWATASVIDDFDQALAIDTITNALQSVGFNTVPSWMRPYKVLSTGERFRVDVARRLVELKSPVIVDEFTSVVDRQVAQIGAYAVQKFVRKQNKQFVAVSCHADVIDWLMPDWVYKPATSDFDWGRHRQSRPTVSISIGRVAYSAWELFAPFHYLTASLNKSARCFALFCNNSIAAFCGVLYRPHPKTKNLLGVSRLVTLPDWQGLGLAFVLVDAVASYYKAVGFRMHMYPAHPVFINAFRRSPVWQLVSEPGLFANSSKEGQASISNTSALAGKCWFAGSQKRPCAVFGYEGAAFPDKKFARALVDGKIEDHDSDLEEVL